MRVSVSCRCSKSRRSSWPPRTSALRGSKPSFQIAVMHITSRRIPDGASANQGPENIRLVQVFQIKAKQLASSHQCKSRTWTGFVCKAHGFVFHATLDSGVIKKKKKKWPFDCALRAGGGCRCSKSRRSSWPPRTSAPLAASTLSWSAFLHPTTHVK